MKNVSTQFKDIIKEGGTFCTYVTAVLADGTPLTFDSEEDFASDGNSYTESGGSGFPLGVALSKQISLSIENNDDRYSEYDFYGAVFTLYTETDLEDGSTERIPEGIFTVIDSVAPGDSLAIEAYDNMYKLDSDFTSGLSYPATLQQVWNELCTQYDLTNGSASFKNSDFIVNTAPTGVTGRELAGYIAQIAIGNAIIDTNGRLCIKSYDFTPLDTAETITDDAIETASGAHILSDFTDAPDIGTDDVSITGIQTTVTDEDTNEESTLLYGTDVYALSIDNPLISGREQTAIAIIGEALIGLTVRPFSGSFSPNPTIEFMDPVYVIDRKDNVYPSFVTENSFNYLGNSDVSNGLESPERNRATYSGNATEVYRRLQQQINNQKSSFETAVENLETQLQNASGLYQTEEVQGDGSTIYYFHNKPTLEESDTIIKITSQALGISTDGGATYPVGITVDGEAVISILQTIGINADWINAGTIQVTDNDGNIIFSVDMDTNQVIISGDSIRIGNQTLPEVIADSQSLSVVLSNEYQAIPTNFDGSIDVFPDVNTTVQVYYGSNDVTGDCIYNVTASSGVTGNWDSSTHTYTVTGLSEDTGWVDIAVTYLSTFSVTKRFNIQKIKNGEAGTIYILETSTDIVKRGSANMPSPDNVTFTAYKRYGDSTSRTEYAGRWIIAESEDGEEWTTVYESSEDESSVTHSLYAILADADEDGLGTEDESAIATTRDDVAFIRAYLYASGGTVDLIDTQTVTIVEDADSLTHEDIFNLLTNNGEMQGIYQEGNQLYINAQYIKSGTLTLGGNNNVNGTLKVLDSSGTEIGYWDNSGIYVDGGEIVTTSSEQKSSLKGGALYVYRDDIELGFIGANNFVNYPENRGINFNLNAAGSYMSWGRKENDSDSSYILKLFYANKTFSEFEADNLYVGCNIDMQYFSIKNAVLTDCQLSNIISINGYAPANGTYDVVTKIEQTSSGNISWTYGTVTIRNGLVTAWPT